jgi:hypothetical protein
MKHPRCRAVCLAMGGLLCLITLCLTLLVAEPADRAARLYAQDDGTATRGPVVDGRYVHNVGNLQMNVTNWGFFGSLPKSRYPMADQPSAQWPAGSGIDYLYAAGIWVGAISQGIPTVSTGYPETEFYPPQDARGDIYVAAEGVFGGDRPPGPSDDDLDSLYNEDWLNGWDDDMDGRIDEDYQAIGKQMFSCFYTDDQIAAQQVFPEHTPMGIEIRQESYQWGEDGLNDFVGVRYYVKNASMNYLSGVYIGIYADVDAGPREYGSYHMDDQVGYFEGIWCVQEEDAEVPVNTYVGYVYDGDGDNGKTPGYFGIALMGYPVLIYYGDGKGKYDFQWYIDPGTRSFRLSTFRVFRGLQPFEHGGEPTNDYERYEVLSSGRKDDNSTTANDYKILMAVGPFSIEPGETQYVDFAFVCGDGLEDMLDHAAIAQLVYQGCFYDADNDPDTGVDGRETMIIGPYDDFMPDPCNSPVKYDLAPKETAWANRDCSEEIWKWQYQECYTPPAIDKSRYVTGLWGQETRLNWITGSAPPPPNIRLVPHDCAVTVLWDNFSETVPDPILLMKDFEGYQIWRADDWHRPYGTTTLSGPTAELWHMLAIRDRVNGLAPDVDFGRPFEDGGWGYEPLAGMPNKEQLIYNFESELIQAPLDKVACPPGLSEDVCDTLEALARFNLGFEGGKQYYKFTDVGVKNGLHYFYSVIAYDHVLSGGQPISIGRFNSPASNFKYVSPISDAQDADEFEDTNVYVVPNPVTPENVEPWRLNPNNSDPSGIKCEFHNLPKCRSTVRIYTVAGDLVQVLHHDGSDGNGTQKWNLLSRNGQEITSGVYLFSVEPEDGRFQRTIGKFVVIR